MMQQAAGDVSSARIVLESVNRQDYVGAVSHEAPLVQDHGEGDRVLAVSVAASQPRSICS